MRLTSSRMRAARTRLKEDVARLIDEGAFDDLPFVIDHPRADDEACKPSGIAASVTYLTL
jgi:hypothetical protein